MIPGVEEYCLRLLLWLAGKHKTESPDADTLLYPNPDETEAEMEEARQRIREAQQSIAVVQAGLNVVTRRKKRQ